VGDYLEAIKSQEHIYEEIVVAVSGFVNSCRDCLN
jgi:hypothetical protein